MYVLHILAKPDKIVTFCDCFEDVCIKNSVSYFSSVSSISLFLPETHSLLSTYQTLCLVCTKKLVYFKLRCTWRNSKVTAYKGLLHAHEAEKAFVCPTKNPLSKASLRRLSLGLLKSRLDTHRTSSARPRGGTRAPDRRLSCEHHGVRYKQVHCGGQGNREL